MTTKVQKPNGDIKVDGNTVGTFITANGGDSITLTVDGESLAFGWKEETFYSGYEATTGIWQWALTTWCSQRDVEGHCSVYGWALLWRWDSSNPWQQVGSGQFI